MNVISINSYANWSHCAVGVSNVNSLTMLQNHFRLKSESFFLDFFFLLLCFFTSYKWCAEQTIHGAIHNSSSTESSTISSLAGLIRSNQMGTTAFRLCTSNSKSSSFLLAVHLMRCQTFSSIPYTSIIFSKQ